MVSWVELGILVFLAGGVVKGYFLGLRHSAVMTLLLALFLLASLSFGGAGADYMITYHDADSKIMPVLLDRFPLVIPVSPGNQAVEAPLEAVLLVRDMPLVPAYRDWLAGLSHSKRWGANLTGYHILARVFSLLLVRRGFFMLFLFAFMAGRGIIAHALGGKGRPREKPEERLAAALLGGACSFILIAAVLTAMAPFSPLFLGFLAWDLAQSPMADFFVARGLYIFPGF